MDHYRRRIKELINEYNRVHPAPFYFERFLTGKREVSVADLGAGPICTIGNIWGKVKMEIHPSDVLAKEYNALVADLEERLLIPIEYQDMEALTYADESFDIVHCVNAVDHTKNAAQAISEMKRICKKGGYIYLRHAHNQMKVNGGRGHYWNATRTGFSNDQIFVALDGFHTTDDGYFLVSIMKKV